MKSWTYFAKPVNGGPMKIGRSINPNKRMTQIRPAVSLFAAVPEEKLSERAAHEMFADRRVSGEWFEIDESEILSRLNNGGINPIFSVESEQRRKMILLLEIDDEIGALLDAIAKNDKRSRSSQAAFLLEKAIREAANEPQPEEATA